MNSDRTNQSAKRFRLTSLQRFSWRIFAGLTMVLFLASWTAHAAPADENFDGVVLSGGYSFGASPRTINGWTFRLVDGSGANDGDGFVDVTNESGDTALANSASDKALLMGGWLNVAASARISTLDGSEFSLVSFRVDNGAASSGNYRALGYRDGSAVTGASQNFSAATYAETLVTLSDPAWQYVDEFRIVRQDSSADVSFYIDDIDVSAAVIPNLAPTDIQLSNATVNQSAGANAAVGTLSTTDPDADPSFTYTLVAGNGDTHNASFNISEASLRANNASALAAGNYSVRVQTDDGNGGTYAEAFTVTVTPGTFIWSGAEDAGREWTRPGNWLGNVVPPAGADLLFPADAVRRESINNQSGFVVRSMTIEASFYDIYGEPIVLLNGLTTTFGGGNAWFSLNTTLDTVQSFNVAAGGELICFGNFSGSQGLTKTGGGTMRFVNANDNTYFGATAVQSGTLLLTARNGAIAIPGNLTIEDGATVQFHGSTDFEGSTIGEGQTTFLSSVTVGESATFDLNGRTNSIVGLTLQGGAVLTGTDGHLTVAGGVTHNASANHVTSTIQGPGVLDLSGGDREFAVANDAELDVELRIGAVVANGAITKTGTGTLALAGDNTYTGDTTLVGGRLRAESNNAFGDPATSRAISIASERALELGGGIALPATKTFNFEGNADRIVNVSGSNRILGAVSIAHDSWLNVADGSRLDLDGAVTSSAWLYKKGGGTLVFGASNPALTGRFYADEGALLVNGSIAGTDQTPVASGATLGGSGFVSAVVVSSGGALTPGTSPGILSSGNLTLSSNATLDVELDGTTVGTQYDQLDVTGTVSLGGATLNVALGFAATSGDTFVIIANDGADAVAGTFGGLAEGTIFTAGSDRFQVSYVGGDGNDVVLTHDPNAAPTDIMLSNSSVNQSGGENATVGGLTTTDADGSDTHTYTLVAGTGDTDNGSFNIFEASLRANNSGALSAGSYSVRVQTDDGRGGTYAEAFAITVADDVAPTVVGVTAPTNGTYRASVFLDFTVSFTEPVTVLGVPALELTVGETARTATFHSGGGTTDLVFRHTVEVDHEDTDGVAVGALTAAGGTIRDAAANDAVLTLNNVASTAGVLVDGVAPLVSSVTRKTPLEQVTDATTVVFEVTFSEDMLNVDAAGFAVTPVNDGTVTANVTGVSGGPRIYDVTVLITGGLGEFRLDVNDQ